MRYGKYYHENKDEIDAIVEKLYRVHNEKLPSDKLYHFYFYRELKKNVISNHSFWCKKNNKRNIKSIPSLILDERIPREALSSAICLVDDKFKRENDIPKYYELTEIELIKKSYKKYPINTIEYFLFNLSYNSDGCLNRDSVFDNLKDRIIIFYSNNFFDLKRIPNINLKYQYSLLLEYLFWKDGQNVSVFLEKKIDELKRNYITEIYFSSIPDDYKTLEIYNLLYQTYISDFFPYHFYGNIISCFELYEILIRFISKDFNNLCNENNLFIPQIVSAKDFKIYKNAPLAPSLYRR